MGGFTCVGADCFSQFPSVYDVLSLTITVVGVAARAPLIVSGGVASVAFLAIA